MSSRHEKKRAAMAARLEETSGRSVDGWVLEVELAGLGTFNEIVEWLKSEHGLGHFQARLVAESHRERS